MATKASRTTNPHYSALTDLRALLEPIVLKPHGDTHGFAVDHPGWRRSRNGRSSCLIRSTAALYLHFPRCVFLGDRWHVVNTRNNFEKYLAPFLHLYVNIPAACIGGGASHSGDHPVPCPRVPKTHWALLWSATGTNTSTDVRLVWLPIYYCSVRTTSQIVLKRTTY